MDWVQPSAQEYEKSAKANDCVNSTYFEVGDLAFISYTEFPHWGDQDDNDGELHELLPQEEHGSGDESQPDPAERYSCTTS